MGKGILQISRSICIYNPTDMISQLITVDNYDICRADFPLKDTRIRH